MPEFTTTLRVPNYAGAPGSPLKGQLYFDTTTNVLYWYNGAAWQNVALPTNTLAKVVYLIAASGTYTPTAGARTLVVELVGGGGSGGSAQSSASNAAPAGGGGGGGYAIKYLAAPLKASYAYVVGAGGAPVSNGGSTTFDSPSICTATGGVAGTSNVTGGTDARWTGTGGAGGNGTVGDVAIPGGDGQWGMRFNGTSGKGGQGGVSFFGVNPGQGSPNAGTAFSGAVYGTGGAGAISYSATAYTGGSGSQGIIRISEYF